MTGSVALAVVAAAPAAPAQPARQATGGSRTLTRFRRSWLLTRLQAGIPSAGRAVASVSIAALVVLAITVALAGGPAPAPASGGRAVLKTATIGGATVLTSAQGFTLYWFAPDTPSRSNCYGVCAGYWPPVTGTATPGAGIPGKLGAIRRSDGTTQVTYNGHPLYTYVGDTQPGQAKGNGIMGVWHEVTPGTAAADSSPGTGGNGY